MRRAAFLVWVPLAVGFMPATASDSNPLGFYIGGAVAQARDTYTAFGASDETKTAAGWGVNQTQTDFAYGAGVQAQVARLGFRAECERANSSIAHPNLLSFGVTWTF